MNGFLFVDKPQSLSSFDIIKIARRALSLKKIGHNGTLDPQATGLLVLAVGKATRLLPYLPSEPKTYTFSIQFGKTTDTLDCAGSVIEQGKPFPSAYLLAESLKLFHGNILQKPPQYSAIKINGSRAYKLARQNKTFILPPRGIIIHSLKLLQYNEEKGEAILQTECSKGTYIRSLSRDIAEKVGTVGYAASIRRTAINGFTLKNAIPLESIQQNAQKYLRSINTILAAFPSYAASPMQIQEIAHGQEIVVDTSINNNILFIYNSEQELIAVANKVSSNRYHPTKVFIEQ